jgi:hypothetical protein
MNMSEVCEQPVLALENPTSPEVRMERPEVYYDVARKDYWIKNTREDWITVNETSLRRQLRSCGFSATVREGEVLSDLEECLNKIQRHFDVAYAGPLAGYQKGLIEICSQRILVTSSPKLIEPQSGECPVLNQLLASMFREQLSYIRGWLKIAYESLRNGHLRPGQVLVLAGERDSGKSLLQNLITVMFGGRAAKPYRYMRGKTEFNGELFGAEHLMIEDEVASNDLRARRDFGARIKDFTVNEVQSCHIKNRQAISLRPFWRVSVSLNDEPENLMMLPPLDDSLADKLILLKVYKAPLPMPTLTRVERGKFWQTLLNELPAFLDDLTQWEIPAALEGERFGVKHFHHPELLEALEDLAPEAKLLIFIDLCFKEGLLDSKGFEGPAEELERRLLACQFRDEVSRLLSWSNATGSYLGRLAKKHPDRVSQIRTATQRRWKVTPPK